MIRDVKESLALDNAILESRQSGSTFEYILRGENGYERRKKDGGFGQHLSGLLDRVGAKGIVEVQSAEVE